MSEPIGEAQEPCDLEHLQLWVTTASPAPSLCIQMIVSPLALSWPPPDICSHSIQSTAFLPHKSMVRRNFAIHFICIFLNTFKYIFNILWNIQWEPHSEKGNVPEPWSLLAQIYRKLLALMITSSVDTLDRTELAWALNSIFLDQTWQTLLQNLSSTIFKCKINLTIKDSEWTSFYRL